MNEGTESLFIVEASFGLRSLSSTGGSFSAIFDEFLLI